MITILYYVDSFYPISDYGLSGLLRIFDRLHALSRTSRVAFYDIPFSIRIAFPFRLTFRRLVMLVMYIAILVQVCVFIYIVIDWLF
jgi:hypothetical protein